MAWLSTAIVVLLAAIAGIIRILLVGVFGGRRRVDRLVRDSLKSEPPESRIREALDLVDPCRLGVLEAEDIYRRVAVIVAPALENDVRGEDFGGCDPLGNRVRGLLTRVQSVDSQACRLAFLVSYLAGRPLGSV